MDKNSTRTETPKPEKLEPVQPLQNPGSSEHSATGFGETVGGFVDRVVKLLIVIPFNRFAFLAKPIHLIVKMITASSQDDDPLINLKFFWL